MDLSRAELVEESLAELLEWITAQEIYDDQLSPDTEWVTRLREHTRPDGSAPLAPVFEDVYVRVDDLPCELADLADMVDRARSLLDGGRLEAALGRRRLRQRLPKDT